MSAIVAFLDEHSLCDAVLIGLTPALVLSAAILAVLAVRNLCHPAVPT